MASAGYAQQPLSSLPNAGDLFVGQTTGSSLSSIYPAGGPISFSQASMAQSHQAFTMPSHSMTSQAPVPITQSPFTIRDFADGHLQHGATAGANTLSSASLGDLFPGSFDMEGFDFPEFDNRYGAAEFGMLNHMSTGMANSPPSDSTGTFHPSSSSYTSATMSTVYEHSPSEETQYPYQTSQHVGQWSTDPSAADVRAAATKYLLRASSQDGPPAFAIGNSALPSPSSISSPQGMAMAGYDDSPTNKNLLTNANPSPQAQARPDHVQSHQRQGLSAVSASATFTPSVKVQTLPSRRHRNPSTVYEDVKNPYSYTAAFHSLTALIQRRFSPHKTAHIAKALAAIRPSFISSTMKLNRDDLIFMEKCLQRTLWEFEDFISATATPTIICRRTGEVVAVGKEFSILTGWSANVLLGREPNLNINRGGGDLSSGPPGTGASSLGGTNTPRNPTDTRTEHPVNIVDLLDDDSVCDFFDDYAHLAFGDSRGSVTTPCTLRKYRTANDINLTGNWEDQVGSKLKRRRDPGPTSGSKGDGGLVTQLGNDNGTVDCMLCWSVKRDVFDIPMLCVLNVSLALLQPRTDHFLTDPSLTIESLGSPLHVMNMVTTFTTFPSNTGQMKETAGRTRTRFYLIIFPLGFPLMFWEAPNYASYIPNVGIRAFVIRELSSPNFTEQSPSPQPSLPPTPQATLLHLVSNALILAERERHHSAAPTSLKHLIYQYSSIHHLMSY